MTVKKIAYLLIGLFIGTICILLYYYKFSCCVQFECDGNFILPYNIPDHNFFTGTLKELDSLSFSSLIISNHGIVLFYKFFSSLSMLEFDDNVIIWFSLVFNLTLYFMTIYIFFRLNCFIRLHDYTILIFALYPPFLFFSTLINKDLMLVFLIVLVTAAIYKKMHYSVIIISLLILLIRQQYVLFPVLTYFMINKEFKLRALVSYVFTSILAGLIANQTSIFDFSLAVDSVSGFSKTVYSINKEYVLGSLFLNPVRIIHYFLSFFYAWFLFYQEYAVNLMKVIEAVTFFYLLILVPGIISFLRRSLAATESRELMVLRSAVLAFIFVLLLTPILEPRYFMTGYPIFLLAANYGIRFC